MKIRVLHVIDSFDLGGGQTALLNLLHALDRDRFEPEVACMHGRGVFWEEFANLGIAVHSLSPHKYLPVYLAKLARIILDRRPCIVHCHLFGSNWIAKPLAALLGVRVRVNHDQCNDALRYERRFARWVDKQTNRFSSHVCAVSASTRDFLVKHEHLPPARISLVYNGVDLRRFLPPPAKPRLERFVVLGVGRLHAQKNFALFLDVAAELAKRQIPVEFRLAGTGPEEQLLRSQARTLGISDKVHFLGHVSDTRTLYSGADALLMTSKYEGTPLTVLEAAAMRLPIVAPRLDGIGEILKNEEDALLIEPPDCNHFSAALIRLIEEPEFATTMARKAEEKVRKRFSAQIMAAQVEAVYDICLAATNHE
jgi:glycosyltransferase involved in cell wall biosynthesis